MNDVEPAESDVGEREIMREEEADVSRDAGQQRAYARTAVFYWLHC